MKRAWFLLFVGVIVAAGCKSPTGPDSASLVGTWNATKAEFVKAADTNTKVDIVTQGSTVSLVMSSSTFTLTITDPGESPVVSTGTWSSSTDVLTLTWSSGYVGEAQFDMALVGSTLTLEGGHLPHEFTPGNPEEAILNLTLAKQ